MRCRDRPFATRATKQAIFACAVLASGFVVFLLAIGLPERGDRLKSASARAALEKILQVPLATVEPVRIKPGMIDVEQTLAGQTSNERVLVVIFTSTRATVQLTAGSTGNWSEAPNVIQVENVVVLYENDRGTVDRRAELYRALRGLTRTR